MKKPINFNWKQLNAVRVEAQVVGPDTKEDLVAMPKSHFEGLLGFFAGQLSVVTLEQRKANLHAKINQCQNTEELNELLKEEAMIVTLIGYVDALTVDNA